MASHSMKEPMSFSLIKFMWFNLRKFPPDRNRTIIALKCCSFSPTQSILQMSNKARNCNKYPKLLNRNHTYSKTGAKTLRPAYHTSGSDNETPSLRFTKWSLRSCTDLVARRISWKNRKKFVFQVKSKETFSQFQN